jgi:hypothetical protein
MYDVDKSLDEGNTLKEDLLMLNEEKDHITPLNFWLMTHWKTFHFQDCCLMITIWEQL